MINLKKYFSEKKEEKKRSNLFTYVATILFSVSIAIIILVGVFSAKKYIYMNIVKNDIVAEVTSLVDINKDIRNKKGAAKMVTNFDIEKDTLPFKNFRTYDYPGGNCEGYNMYELLKFEGDLEKILGDNMKGDVEIDLSSIEFTDIDINNIYNVTKNEMISYYFDYSVLNGRTIDYQSLVKKAYGYDREKATKLTSDFNEKEFDNKELKNILTDIQYIHNNKKYTIYNTEPYYTKNPEDKKKGVSNKYSFGDIDFIKNNIDDDKLIEISILNDVSGHSLLAYGYEKINESNYKVYVKDSNFPIINKENLTTEDERVNEDIKSNFYVLFTKDMLKDRWSYIYQPSINGVDIYGYFNSFMPGTQLGIYSTGL